MTETLTLELIADAQANGLAGTTAVLDAMNVRLDRQAAIAARRMNGNSRRFGDHLEDYRQDAALAMFEALPRFDGSSVDNFYAFMWTTVENALKDSVREVRNQGADIDAMKIFGSMMGLSDGDTFLAEKLSQTVPAKGRRLSADRARAARISWQGTHALDGPASQHGDSGSQAGDEAGQAQTLAEALSGDLAFALGVPEDLLDAADVNSEDKRKKHAIVHAILSVMSPGQSAALRHSYGIGDVTCYGTGDAGDLPGLAAEMGVSVITARDARTKGHKSFAKRYIKAVARDEAHEAELTAAAADNLSAGGRK